MQTNRRKLIQGAAAGAGLLGAGASFAQAGGEIRIGLLTVKTGPLASGGIDMERGLAMYLAERNNMLAGRKITVIVADTGGVPATSRTKTQELVERNKGAPADRAVGGFRGTGHRRLHQGTGHSHPGGRRGRGHDTAQGQPVVRARHRDLFAKRLSDGRTIAPRPSNGRRMALIADDIAYGHEMLGGFQRVFEEAGGKIVQKMFPPLTVPDYGTFLAQLKTNVDGLFLGFAGSNGFRYLRQFNEYGLRGKVPVVGGMTALDESVLRNMGDEALGILTSCWYSAELNNPINKRFAEAFRKEHKYDPGFYAASTYVNGAVLEAALDAVKGKIEDKQGFMKALRGVKAFTARGPVSFDALGNVVGDVFIRRVERKDGRLVNTVQQTYPNVSQFWTYNQAEFLKNPVYSRDFPPARNLEP